MIRSDLGQGSSINPVLSEVTEKSMKNFRIIRFPTEFPNGKLPDTRQQPDSLSLLASLVSVIIYYTGCFKKSFTTLKAYSL